MGQQKINMKNFDCYRLHLIMSQHMNCQSIQALINSGNLYNLDKISILIDILIFLVDYLYKNKLSH